jgi:uncharacterized membrane protein YbhN (UPF0104 family)
MDVTMRRRTPRISRLWFQIGLAACAVVVAVLTLRGSMPSPSAIVAAMSRAQPSWIVVAALAQVISMELFTHQHRSLLRSLGIRMRLRRVRSVTYAGSAISISLPAGSAVSAGFVFGQYRRGDTSGAVAAAAIALSGVISAGGLMLLYAGGVASVVGGWVGPLWNALLLSVLCVLAGAAALAGASRLAGPGARRPRGAGARPPSWVLRLPGAAAGWTNLMAAVRAGGALRYRDWLVPLALAAGNWLADLLCLAAASRAFGLPVGLSTIAGVYLGVQIVRLIPLTPGGIGVVEAALVAGLTAGGGTAAATTGVVLAYRLLTSWLLVPIGGLAWLTLRDGAPKHSTAVQSTAGPEIVITPATAAVADTFGQRVVRAPRADGWCRGGRGGRSVDNGVRFPAAILARRQRRPGSGSAVARAGRRPQRAAGTGHNAR